MKNSYEISLGGRVVSYSVRHSARAKNISIRVSPDSGLEVVLPGGIKSYNLESCLKGREAWITAKLDHYQRLREKKANSGQAMFLGREYGLVPVIKHQATTAVKILDGKIFVTVPDHSPETLTAALEKWYRSQAAAEIGRRVRDMSRLMGLEYNRICIRNQKTRWGSCSGKKNLNFNWRLVMAPARVIDYLAVHELAHLKEMNHSLNFWRLVENYCPDFKALRKWLKDNGTLLNIT